MDRWRGILKVALYSNSNTVYKVGASLCFSNSTKSLVVASANVIFFTGDRVQGTGNPVIERLSNVQTIADILVSKFGTSINAWVVEAPIYNGPYAVYKDFIPCVNEYGEPNSYDPTGFPASTSTFLLLSNCLKQVNNIISGKENDKTEEKTKTKTKTIIIGFSKGGIILNQLVSEFELAIHEKEQFMNSVSEIHYVDVGLNCKGAYINNGESIDKLCEYLKHSVSEIRFFFHGTPRQWCDGRRIWIVKEKDELVRLLKDVAQKNIGKLFVCERLYFSDTLPNLQMHFEIIENLDVNN